MTAGSLLADLCWVVGLGSAPAVVSLLLDGGVPIGLWYVLSLVLVTGHRLVARMAYGRSTALIREDSELPAFVMPDRPFAAMRAWEERLELVRGDADYFRQAVLPKLTALVEERLRLGYGIEPRKDPERARAVLGPKLTEFLYADPRGSATRPPSRSELAALATELEKLWTNQR